jgi:segregation and condensation protein B
LETLALIAYKQPITRSEIEDIRGVAVSSHIIKTLIERTWIKTVGHKEVPGRPVLYASTQEFLDYFSLTSLEQLPELMPMAELTGEPSKV